MLQSYRKSIVAIIGAVVTVLAINGVDVDPEIVTAVTTLITASLVWWVPND
jgi:hypothetical protein